MKLNSNKVWWNQYRKAMIRKPKTIDKEKLLRSSFRTALKEYFKNSSLPGVKYMINPEFNKFQKLGWIIILFSVCAAVTINMYSIWTGVLSNPMIVSMESSIYPAQYLDFPAIALCNVNRISRQAAKEFAFEVKEIFPNIPLNKLQYFVEQYGRMIDFEISGSSEFMSFIDRIPVHLQATANIPLEMKTLSPQCDRFLEKCSWKNQEIPCEDLFTTRRTSHGHCCVFNYLMEWDEEGNPVETSGEPMKQGIPGLLYGLNIILDPEPEDYAYPLHNIVGVDVLIFDSNHYPDHNNGLLIHRIAEVNNAVFIAVESRTQVATKEVRKYSLNTRKCMFKDEFPSEFDNMYTFSSCIISCRIKTMQSLCKCTPFYLPVSNSTPICNWADLYCLHKYREKFLYLYPIDAVSTDGLEMEMQDSLFCPQCLPDCEFTRHYTRSSTTPMTDGSLKDMPYAITVGTDLRNKTFISVYRPTPDGILDKLDVVSYWYEILSNFGGAAGLLVGYSIVSTVEFLYYITFRFFIIFYQKLKESQYNY